MYVIMNQHKTMLKQQNKIQKNESKFVVLKFLHSFGTKVNYHNCFAASGNYIYTACLFLYIKKW